MFLLILDSLGSTELLFILVMALVFFGPRKLPQISRTLGKNLAEFRKASEDFKRTWEREVALEEFKADSDRSNIWQDDLTNTEEQNETFQDQLLEPVAAEEAVARQTTTGDAALTTGAEITDDGTQSETARKQDWL